MKNKLILICGPSGVGKGTIINHFLNNYKNLEFSISATTRQPRAGEVNKKHYYFLTKESFQEKINNNEFLEYAKFSGNFYGTLKAQLEEKLKKSNVIMDIEIQGAKQLFNKNLPYLLSIFIMPPSIEVLEQRLINRQSETRDQIKNRIKNAKKEIKDKNLFDYIVVNDKLEDAIKNVQNIFKKENIKL